MYYSIDIYLKNTMVWSTVTETDSIVAARTEWQEFINKGWAARVRVCQDLTSGKNWLG